MRDEIKPYANPPKINWRQYGKCDWCGAEPKKPCMDDDDDIAWKVCITRPITEQTIEQFDLFGGKQ